MSQMRITTAGEAEKSSSLALRAISFAPWTEPCWFAVQTVARHEKAVSAQLVQRDFDTFLPLRVDVRKWGTRKVTVELPLFSGYVFANFPYRERLKILTARGVLRVVSFNNLPSPVSDEEIQALRGMSGLPSLQSCKFLEAGRSVRISSGALEGLEGVIVKRKSHIRFIVSVQAIRQSIAVEVSANDLQCIQ